MVSLHCLCMAWWYAVFDIVLMSSCVGFVHDFNNNIIFNTGNNNNNVPTSVHALQRGNAVSFDHTMVIEWSAVASTDTLFLSLNFHACGFVLVGQKIIIIKQTSPLINKKNNLLHALCSLLCNVYEHIHWKFDLLDMQVFVQAWTITPLCNDCKKRPWRAAHEQQYVNVSRLPGLTQQSLHLILC